MKDVTGEETYYWNEKIALLEADLEIPVPPIAQTYWASSDYHEFEVELLEETEYGDFKVRCVLEDEILILTGHLWSLELMTDNGKMIYEFSRTDRTEF